MLVIASHDLIKGDQGKICQFSKICYSRRALENEKFPMKTMEILVKYVQYFHKTFFFIEKYEVLQCDK